MCLGTRNAFQEVAVACFRGSPQRVSKDSHKVFGGLRNLFKKSPHNISRDPSTRCASLADAFP